MEKARVCFLGTGDSIPTKKRSHPAILLSYKDENILIDCGEGTQRQFKIADLNPCKLTRILITHWHGDHFFGLPGLLQTLNMQGCTKTIEIYGPKGTINNMRCLKQLINLPLNIKVQEVENKVLFETKDFYVEAKSMIHGTPANAYAFVIKDKIRLDKNKLKKFKLPNSPLLQKLKQGKDILFNNKKIRSSDVSYKEKGKKITFILDTMPNKNAVSLAKDSDILIIESTFSINEKEQAIEKKHLTAKDAADIAKKAKVKRVFLVHVSQRYENDLSQIEKEAKKIFKNVSIAKDFETLEF